MRLQHILVPVDFTETSDHALDYAMEMAKKVGAKVTAIHVYELPIYGFPDGAFVASAEIATKISDASQHALEATVAKQKGKGVEIEGVLRNGAPWEVIHEIAKDRDCDLIIMGTHGRRGVARALLGSVAEKVIRTAERPVMAVRLPEPA